MKINAAERQPFLEQMAKWKAGRNPSATITMLNLSVNQGLQYNYGSLILDSLNVTVCHFAFSAVPQYR